MFIYIYIFDISTHNKYHLLFLIAINPNISKINLKVNTHQQIYLYCKYIINTFNILM